MGTIQIVEGSMRNSNYLEYPLLCPAFLSLIALLFELIFS